MCVVSYSCVDQIYGEIKEISGLLINIFVLIQRYPVPVQLYFI